MAAGRRTKNDDELYAWGDTCQQERDKFNALLGDIEIDLGDDMDDHPF